jgi:hypothetical protein
MSYEDGWAAMNLQMPPRVPHTEFSLDRHWGVVNAVTGLQINSASPVEQQNKASFEFMKIVNYDFRWTSFVERFVFGDFRTDMGHAEYEENGADRRDHMYCPFTSPEEVLEFDFWNTYGPINQSEWAKKFDRDYSLRCQETPDLVNNTGIYITMISGLLEVFGWDMLLWAAGTNLQGFGKVADRYASWIMQYFEALAASSVPLVTIHDDFVWSSGPIFNPQWYRQFVFSNYKKLFAPLIDAKKKIIFTSDGNWTLFIDDIAACGPHGFLMEPTTDMAYIADKYGKDHVFIGNFDTRILLSGTTEDIKVEVERCMAIGKHLPGFFICVSNHIPSNTPIENVLYYLDTIDKLGKR